MSVSSFESLWAESVRDPVGYLRRTLFFLTSTSSSSGVEILSGGEEKGGAGCGGGGEKVRGWEDRLVTSLLIDSSSYGTASVSSCPSEWECVRDAT